MGGWWQLSDFLMTNADVVPWLCFYALQQSPPHGPTLSPLPKDRREGLVSRPKGAPKIPVGKKNFYSPPSKDRREGLKILLKTSVHGGGLCCTRKFTIDTSRFSFVGGAQTRGGGGFFKFLTPKSDQKFCLRQCGGQNSWGPLPFKNNPIPNPTEE